jgi:hypothetical protein
MQALTSSTITCPGCGRQETMTMPVDACVVRWTCAACSLTVKPKPGDCCVFCSFGDVKCPPIQMNHDCCKR